MSDETVGRSGSFLSRWSQRKQAAREAAIEPVEQAEADARGPQDVKGESSPDSAAVTGTQENPEPAFDPASVPKLEDISGSTDMTAFMQKNVPEELRNAALRKSWALDPAIRDYVSPALEYAYDWNTPGGVPGTGAIGAGVNIARMVDQVMGAANVGDGYSGSDSEALLHNAADIHNDSTPDLAAVQSQSADLLPASVRTSHSDDLDIADNTISSTEGSLVESSHGVPEDDAAVLPLVRRHGSAVPKV